MPGLLSSSALCIIRPNNSAISYPLQAIEAHTLLYLDIIFNYQPAPALGIALPLFSHSLSPIAPYPDRRPHRENHAPMPSFLDRLRNHALLRPGAGLCASIEPRPGLLIPLFAGAQEQGAASLCWWLTGAQLDD